MPRSFVELDGNKVVGDLSSVAEEPPFKPNVKIEKVGDYWTAIVRPRDFDAAKKYPVIVHVYGGPKHLTVVRAMRNWLVGSTTAARRGAARNGSGPSTRSSARCRSKIR
jgi:dipeptidyl-peptidase-4